ncbi:MAG TPA: alpha/beta fold hydrolase [Solirubrobacteraceae bacterium]
MSATGTFVREDTAFDSHGARCVAWLYRPGGDHDPPIVVMGHGFAATREMGLAAYAERFAHAGFAVLVFDYRSFGDSAGEPRRVLDIRMQHQDWRAAIAHARTLSGIDANRVVAWGSSFGGGHVLHLAAEDRDFAAVIAQVPHVSGPASAFSASPHQTLRLAVAGVRDQIGAILGRQPYRVAAVGKPGTLAMMTSPDAYPLAERLAGENIEKFQRENDVAARIAMRLPLYSPGRRATRITAPTLVQVATRDVVTPVRVALKAAERIPNAEIRTYDCSHFEPYLEPHFDGVVSDQLAFLTRVAPARHTSDE